MNKILKNAFSCMTALAVIYGVSANDSMAKDISSYYNNKVLSSEKFDTVTKILNDGVEKYKAKNGIFVLMDASDATILASYTTNERTAIDKRLYEIGSVFNTFDIAMGLESGKIKDGEEIDTSEPLVIEGVKITDPHGSHGMITPEQILIESSSIGAAKIALSVGGEYQYDFFNNLGLLSKINLYGIESTKPTSLGKEQWIKAPRYIATASYGYGIMDTPLHIISAYSAIINGGTYHKPSFEKIDDKKGVSVISAENSELMRKYLRKVVTDGTAKKADSDKYTLMGKTGTADKINEAGKYDDKRTVSTFVGNFEHNNVNYAILVMLDEPKGSKETYGYSTAGWNAVPVAGKIIEELIK